MSHRFESFAPGEVTLLPGIVHARRELNRRYLRSLSLDALLQSHEMEAGLINRWLRGTLHAVTPDTGDDMHWGWESPTCQVRGHFLGHWLSAASRMAAEGDHQLRGRAEEVVDRLAVCQRRNGDGWVAPTPPRYLEWVARGEQIWAPQYVHHKALMGLHDAHRWLGSDLALEIADRFADWFVRWTDPFSREKMDDILDEETGGMLETWADLLSVTGDAKYRTLLERYTRARLFDPLLAGEDPLTNRHANTTIPEVMGAARAWEVTGDDRWREIVEAYWKCAVTDRGTFCTGGQTSGEHWTRPFEFGARLGVFTQEHCTVYNMIRLADRLLRWTGDRVYADYIERNLLNGILAQQNPRTGMVAYYLPLRPGSRKQWGTPTHDFWCCHATLVQAHARTPDRVWYRTADGIAAAGFVPSETRTAIDDVPVVVRQTDRDAVAPPGICPRPDAWNVAITVESERPVEFELLVRVPDWIASPVEVVVNDTPVDVADATRGGGWAVLRRTWSNDRVEIRLPRALSVEPVPDDPERVAFLDGPVVLAAVGEEDRALVGDPDQPDEILAPDDERQWDRWLGGYRTRGQAVATRFIPLHEIEDEPFSVYVPLRRA